MTTYPLQIKLKHNYIVIYTKYQQKIVNNSYSDYKVESENREARSENRDKVVLNLVDDFNLTTALFYVLRSLRAALAFLINCNYLGGFIF